MLSSSVTLSIPFISWIQANPPRIRKELEKLFIAPTIAPGYIYTKTPTGMPSVERLAQGREAFWVAQDESPKHGNPRNIIISDFTLQFCPQLQYHVVQYIPRLGDTHRLFVWQKDRLVEIKTPLDLGQIDYAQITPVSTAQLNELLFKTHGIAADRTAILDAVRFREAYALLGSDEVNDDIKEEINISIDHLKQIPDIIPFLQANPLNLKISINIALYGTPQKLKDILEFASNSQ